jgi:hypothetical protein
MRPPRRNFPFLQRALVAAIFLATAPGSSSAQPQEQKQEQLPHVWNEAVYALAEKIAAALNTSHSFSLEVKDLSPGAPVDLERVRAVLEADTLVRGDRAVPAASADAAVQVTISQNVQGYVLVADLRQGSVEQVAIVPVIGAEDVIPQPGPQPGVQRKIVWQQPRPILDFAQGAIDAHRELWYFLEPDQLVSYEFDDGAQVVRQVQPLPKVEASRDLRGRLLLTDATHVTVFVGGIRCEAAWDPAFAAECRRNSGQQWPMGLAAWTFDPARNNFSGVMIFSNSVTAKFPPFFSAASPTPDLAAQSAARWVIAETDGTAQLFAGAANPLSTFAGWGSDILSLAPACGFAWQVLVTGAGDRTQPDSIQLYEIRDTRAIPVGQPLGIPGPVLALWPGEDGKSARVISKNLETGFYEASIVSVSCGN